MWIAITGVVIVVTVVTLTMLSSPTRRR